MVMLFNPLQNFKLILAANFHGGKLETVGQDAWNVFHEHVLVDELSEDLSIVNVDSTDILLV
jgi:hypothetical protein